MPNWHTHYSMRSQFHVLQSDFWLYMTHIIWPIHRFQTSIHCIHGWVWLQWDCSYCNLYSVSLRKSPTSICIYQIKMILIEIKFFSIRFLVCLCCEKATYGCRGAMVPVHASIGLATFMLAIASSISGLTQKAIWTLG